jgi:similar to spore coat protein
LGKEDFAFHETMDTHELLNLKTVGLLKSKLMQGVVFDQDLRKLMQKNVDASVVDIKELMRLYPYAKKE